MDKTIAAVVVTYNRKELLQKCLVALTGQTVSCHIMVVDNASDDGTCAMVQQLQATNTNIYYQNTGKNLGGAGGFNYGMRWAVEAGYDYVWIMDDDCIPKINALEKLMLADKQLGGPDYYGFLSSVVLWTDGKECVMNRQKIVKHFHRYVELMQHGIVQINQATFVSLLFPTKIIKEVGLPITDFFIWGDDVEYTWRIAIHKKKPCFLVGQSIVTHATANNVGSDIATDDISKLSRYGLAYRNEAYTYRQRGVLGVCIYLARCAKGFLRILTKAREHKMKRMLFLFSGMWRGLFFYPKIEQIEL